MAAVTAVQGTEVAAAFGRCCVAMKRRKFIPLGRTRVRLSSPAQTLVARPRAPRTLAISLEVNLQPGVIMK
jgi:hypothetical protein